MAASDTNTKTAFLIVDTESVPDGNLLAAVKYPGENLSPEKAIERAQAEARELSWNHSEFLPLTFQIPVGVCVIRVGADLGLQTMTCLDAPQFRTSELVRQFWIGYTHYAKSKARLVTFNGRGFDLPLMELAAYRERISLQDYYLDRNRFKTSHIDLQEFVTNYSAFRMIGGMDLLAKMIGLPGKMDVKGEQVYTLFREGKLQEINDYCLCDTLDTYFVFLRTRILTGEITPERELELVAKAKELLGSKLEEFPVLRKYLDGWTALAVE